MAKAKLGYANKAYASVTESAANTLTFSEIPTNVDIFSKRAWVIFRLEYMLTPVQFALMVDDGDTVELALTASNAINTLALSQAAVIDSMTFSKRVATAVGVNYVSLPLIRDFSAFAGGGLIVAPRPLYLAIKGTGLASAGSASMRFYFEQVDLAADEYLELVDFYRMIQ